MWVGGAMNCPAQGVRKGPVSHPHLSCACQAAGPKPPAHQQPMGGRHCCCCWGRGYGYWQGPAQVRKHAGSSQTLKQSKLCSDYVQLPNLQRLLATASVVTPALCFLTYRVIASQLTSTICPSL